MVAESLLGESITAGSGTSGWPRVGAVTIRLMVITAIATP
jgi:hypothetical protein